ncbi:MAG: hypothetical protein WC695_10015 [Candidatus Omnitrophota bacterium]
MFRQAGYYQSRAERYAVYGIWGKAFSYGYKAFCLYLEIPDKKEEQIIKTQEEKVGSALNVCAKFNLYSNELRKEKGKDYIYFLKELLKLAKKDNYLRGVEVLENEIIMQEDLKKKNVKK